MMTTSILATTSTISKTDPCYICPRACGAHRDAGQKGVCGAHDTVLVARSALHLWEEPPISGDKGSGTIFFTHCPLKCVYCQNAALASGQAGRAVTEDELADLCLDLQAQGALNINLVTPTHYTPQIIRAVEQARDRGLKLPIVWNTSGYETVETIQLLEGIVDVYLTDYKYASADLANRYSKAPDYPEVALAAIRQMVKSIGTPRYDKYEGQERMLCGVVVRHLLLPGALEQSKEALQVLFDEFGNIVRYSIMNQYTPVIQGEAALQFPELCARVLDEDYETLLTFADDLGIQNYFWQQGDACLESFIPEWDY